jgi:hypothetical protein
MEVRLVTKESTMVKHSCSECEKSNPKFNQSEISHVCGSGRPSEVNLRSKDPHYTLPE